MAKLKNYTCSNCAGVLIFDSDLEYFDCPFCGAKYSNVDFHGEEILQQARSCLNEKSFDAAKEKYDQILEQEPDNFLALSEVSFCDLKIKNINKLDDYRILKGKDLTSLKKGLVNGRRQSEKSREKFFDRYLNLISMGEEILELEAHEETVVSEEARSEINKRLKSERTHEWFAYEGSWSGMAIGLGSLAITFAILIFIEDTEKMITFGLIAWAILLVVFFAVRAYKLNNFRGSDPAKDFAKETNYNLIIKQRDYEEAFGNLRGLYNTLKKSATIKVDAEPAEEPGTSEDIVIDPDAVINCSKCAARLSLDENKRFYRCNHCGVGYGVSLFFGLPMEKALNALNMGRYTEAETRFESILMVHPSDLEAHLGLVLCGGRWTKISDIDITDDISSSELSRIRARLDRAKSASYKYRDYWGKLEELILFCDQYAQNLKILDNLDDEARAFDAKIKAFNDAYHDKKYGYSHADERQALLNKTYPYKVKNSKLESDFKTLKKQILDLRDDTVLAR